MKKTIVVIMSVMLLLACGNNKTRQAEQVIFDSQPEVEQSEPNIASSVREEVPGVKEKPSTQISSSASSLHSHKSSSYDNMRGFDPASEDDMDDNGMSRYMEKTMKKGGISDCLKLNA